MSTYGEPIDVTETDNSFRPTLAALLRDRAGVVAAGFLLLLVVIALLGPIVYDKDPAKQHLLEGMESPSLSHPLGTDDLGRDMAARMIAGTRITLAAVAIALGVACAVGLIPALVSGYLGGRIDGFIMRCTDFLISLPPLILAIAVIGAIGQGLRNTMIVVGLIMAPNLLRVIRSSVVNVRNEAYMDAARLIGCSHTRILRRHVLRNVLPTIIVMINLIAAQALLAEAGLSFIGLGVVPPQASWGALLKDGVPNLGTAPILIIAPGLAISLTVLSLNLVGDTLRRASRSW